MSPYVCAPGLRRSWEIDVRDFLRAATDTANAIRPSQSFKIHATLFIVAETFKQSYQIHFGLLITELKHAKLLIYNPDLENPKEAFKIIDINDPDSIAGALELAPSYPPGG